MLNDLEKYVLDMIGEDVTNPDVFTDTTSGMSFIRDSLSDAIQEISMVTGINQRKYLAPLREGRAFYRLPFSGDDLGWINEVWLKGQKRRLEQKDFHWLTAYNPRWLYNSGTPERYCPIGANTMAVHPVPSSASDILIVQAVVIPEAYTLGDDRVKLRDEYRYAAGHFVVSEYYASRGDAKQALYHHGLYVEKTYRHLLPYMETAEKAWYPRTDKQGWR